MRLLALSAFLVFVVDQVTKYAVVFAMDLRNLYAIDVWPPYLNFRMAWNRGVNFGLFSDQGDAARWVLIALALGICAFVVVWVRREPPRAALFVSAGVLIGGALGNVVDRVLYGAVADFLNMSCCGFSNPYSYNVADIAVFAGAFGMILFSGRDKTA